MASGQRDSFQDTRDVTPEDFILGDQLKQLQHEFGNATVAIFEVDVDFSSLSFSTLNSLRPTLRRSSAALACKPVSVSSRSVLTCLVSVSRP